MGVQPAEKAPLLSHFCSSYGFMRYVGSTNFPLVMAATCAAAAEAFSAAVAAVAEPPPAMAAIVRALDV